MAKYIDADLLRKEMEMLKKIGGIVPLDNREQKTGYESALIDIEIFLDTLESEKPIPKDLEEAAEKYASSVEGDYAFSEGPDHYCSGDLEDAFIAGYQQGIEKGKDEFKEKAIEGHLFRYPPFTTTLISVSGVNPEAFTNGDTKVKLIIIKEEER